MSIVSTVSTSMPEWSAGRNTRRQRAAGRKRGRPPLAFLSTRRGSQPRSSVRSCGLRIARGRVQITTRAVCPVSRELTCLPRMRSVRRTRIADGVVTSTSVSCVTSSP